MKDLVNDIKTKIEKGQIKMKPKTYFIIGNVLAVCGIVISSILGTLFANFIIHQIRISQTMGYFAQHNMDLRWKMFFKVFPWEYLVLAVFSLIIGLYLIKKFDVSYKENFIILIVLALLTVITMAFALDKAGFNERAKATRFGKGFYRQIPDMRRMENFRPQRHPLHIMK